MKNEVTCAVCGQKSRQARLGSLSGCVRLDLDGRPAPPLRDTMQYWLQECPNCGYIAGDISLPVPKGDPTQHYRLSDVLTDSSLAARFVHYACYLSYEGNSSGAGDHFLYAAWVYDDLKKAARARVMRRFALDFVHDLAGSLIRSDRRQLLWEKELALWEDETAHSLAEQPELIADDEPI